MLALLLVAAVAVPLADVVPLPWAVCVTTVDAGRARFDSYWHDEADARVRRSAILRDGWITQGDAIDREDEYPPHSIVKATVDYTLDAEICTPPEVKATEAPSR